MIIRDYEVEERKRHALLINPPVISFSDFKLEYCQPTGLLRISSLLRAKGAIPFLIDGLETVENRGKHSCFLRGKNLIPRYHFGMKPDEFEEVLVNLAFCPDEVYITSFATYWFESTRNVISQVRNIYPFSKIIVGGIYPTLMPEHANQTLGADLVVVGEIKEASSQPLDMEHYTSPKYLGIKPSKGCPHNCGYCAQQAINNGKMTFQDPIEVCDEIEYWLNKKGIKQVYTFSENFLVNRYHFSGLLKEIIRRDLGIQISAPKGMEPCLLDKYILTLMKEAGWKGVRLALETKSPVQRKKLGRSRNDTHDFERAIEYSIDVGFEPSEIGTFLLYGTPGENLESVVETADYIHSFGGYIIPMAFTPVPGSRIFEEQANFLHSKDPVELAGNLYPFAEYNGYTFDDYLSLEKYFAKLNKVNAQEARCSIDLVEMEKRYSGIYAKSELSFAMGL